MRGKQFLSPAEVAHELGDSSTTVLRLVHDERLPAVRVSEWIDRIPVASLVRYRAGTLEAPFTAALGPVMPRSRFGADKELSKGPSDTESRRAPAAAGVMRSAAGVESGAIPALFRRIVPMPWRATPGSPTVAAARSNVRDPGR